MRWAESRGFEIGPIEAYGRARALEVVLFLPPVGRYVLPVRFAVSPVDIEMALSESRDAPSDLTSDLFAAVPRLLKVRVESGVAYCSLDPDAPVDTADLLFQALTPWRQSPYGYR